MAFICAEPPTVQIIFGQSVYIILMIKNCSYVLAVLKGLQLHYQPKGRQNQGLLLPKGFRKFPTQEVSTLDIRYDEYICLWSSSWSCSCQLIYLLLANQWIEPGLPCCFYSTPCYLWRYISLRWRVHCLVCYVRDSRRLFSGLIRISTYHNKCRVKNQPILY